MPNICTFWGKIVGDEDEVREIVSYFQEPYRYQFIDTKKFFEKTEPLQEKLRLEESTPLVRYATDLYSIIGEIIKTGQGQNIKTKDDMITCINHIIYARIGQRPFKNEPYESEEKLIERYLEKLREHLDLNLLREFLTIPDSLEKGFPITKHFWGIFDCNVSDSGYYDDGRFYVEIFGDCAWSLSLALSPFGYYNEWRQYEGQPWFKGTNLEDVHDAFPELEMEFFSEESGMEFSEHILIKDHAFIEETQNLSCRYYESLEEAQEDGLELKEDQIHKFLYIELPEWFYPVEDMTNYEYDWSI